MLAPLFSRPKFQILTTGTTQKKKTSVRSVIAELDSIAEVTETIFPNERGRVHYQGSSWLATCLEPIAIPEGRRVRIVARDNITLLVETLPNT
jgi:membrane protein implicated in regulation of membrane protease activity